MKRRSNNQVLAESKKPNYKKNKSNLSLSSTNEIKSSSSIHHQLKTFFSNYSENHAYNDHPTIGPDGIQKLCNDLAISSESVHVLILAWFMEAKTMGFFTESEWTIGLSKLNSFNLQDLRSKMKTIDVLLTRNPSQFKVFYRWLFVFAKEEDQRTLDISIALALWSLVFSSPPSSYSTTHFDAAKKGQSAGLLHLHQFSSFLSFIQSEKLDKLKVINKDQWNSLPDFLSSIDKGVDRYDEMSAWPVLFDEFVQYLKR